MYSDLVDELFEDLKCDLGSEDAAREWLSEPYSIYDHFGRAMVIRNRLNLWKRVSDPDGDSNDILKLAIEKYGN